MRRVTALAAILLSLAGGMAQAADKTAADKTAADKPGEVFTLSSPDFGDNGIWPAAFASNATMADGKSCGGSNISPALSFSGVPSGTKSFAVTLFDPDGASGAGVSHWVAYDFAGTAKGLKRGEGAKEGSFVGGTSTRKLPTYFGPCPPVPSAWHHYTFQAFALDIAPGTLPAGLTREALLDKIKGHVLATASLIGRYRR